LCCCHGVIALCLHDNCVVQWVGVNGMTPRSMHTCFGACDWCRSKSEDWSPSWQLKQFPQFQPYLWQSRIWQYGNDHYHGVHMAHALTNTCLFTCLY
jgi:hypothetical protein